MQLFRDKFFILKKTRFSEADLIVEGLSSTGEKHCFLARGALKSKKRFIVGTLEPTHLVDISFRRSSNSNGSMSTILEATLIHDFKGIRNSYEKIQLCLFILNCTRRVCQEGDLHSTDLFNLLGNTLKVISYDYSFDLTQIKLHFLIKFLYQQGVLSLVPWMQPFLSANMLDQKSISSFFKGQDIDLNTFCYQKINDIENLLLLYLHRAEGFEESGCKFSTTVAR